MRVEICISLSMVALTALFPVAGMICGLLVLLILEKLL